MEALAAVASSAIASTVFTDACDGSRAGRRYGAKSGERAGRNSVLSSALQNVKGGLGSDGGERG